MSGHRPMGGMECDLCGTVVTGEEITETTLLDDSGGSIVAVCAACLSNLSVEQCRICDEPKAGSHKSAGLILPTQSGIEERLLVPVCDDCRRLILTGRGQGVLR